MTATPVSRALDQLRRQALAGSLGDAQLLEVFVGRRDDAAFEALVRRHGPMVFAVCRRVAGNPHDAEDAFQATFLVLHRKAAALGDADQLGNWLHGVAYRTALKARALAERRRARERPLVDVPAPPIEPQESWAEMRRLLDRELVRLPDKYRVLVVLCDLEGRPRKEVARLLGLNEGTLSSRLATARSLLAGRLSRYGLAISVAVLAALLAEESASAARLALPDWTSALRASALADAVAAELSRRWLRGAAVLVLGVSLLVAGVALAGRRPADGPRDAPPSDEPAAPEAKSGGRILFWLDEQLAVIGADGKGFTRLPRLARSIDLPCFAPDGKQVAYSPWNPYEDAPEHTPLPVYLTPLDAKPGPLIDFARRVGLDPPVGRPLGVKGRPLAWSADGSQLVCVEPKGAVWVVDVKSGEKKQLPLRDDHWFADWSPDQTLLLTERRLKKAEDRSEPHVFLLKKDGTELRRLTPEGHVGWWPSFSPDGKRVLFCGRPVPKDDKVVFARPSRVYVVDLPDGVAKPVSPELNALVETACWSPDGKRIAYCWRRLEERDDPLDSGYQTDHTLQVIDADGGNPTVLHAEKGEARRVYLSRPQWR